MKRHHRSSNRRGRIDRKGSILLALLVIGLAGLIYLGGSWLQRQGQQPETRSDHTLRYTYEPAIEVDGRTYRRRDRVTTILLMGIDRDRDTVVRGFQNGGQADFLRLLVIDSGGKRVSQVQIDRDTMTPIVTMGVTGKRSGMRNAQISLSHGFGDGGAQSCELTVEAVSNLLLGTQIDFYMALNMDGISVLNDWAGGVTVTLEDDFSMIDPAMTKGATLTLMGDQAETFVRSRMSIGVGTNAARMKRQQAYITQLMTQLEGRLAQDQSNITLLLEALGDDLRTDMAQGRIINEFWAAKDYSRAPLIEPTGVHTVGRDGFMEFEVDKKELQQIVLDLFYDEVK